MPQQQAKPARPSLQQSLRLCSVALQTPLYELRVMHRIVLVSMQSTRVGANFHFPAATTGMARVALTVWCGRKRTSVNTLLPCASWHDFMSSTRRAHNVGPCRGRVGDGDALEALGDYYKCDAGMSVENVPAIVNLKNTGGTIYCTQVLYWMGGGGG